MNIKKIIKRLNRALAGFIAAIMCLTVFPNININADDENGEIFNYLGYSVEYKVVNEWEGNRNIKIKFTNTGSKPIYNWALKFDAGGEITGLWNGAVYYSIGTEYIIKNSGYNYEILPGESVEFGYTLEGNYLTAPNNFEVCAKRIEITENFDVKLVISDKWDGGFTGYIDIANNSEEPFEAWEMAFDANFEINDFWNAKLEKIDGFYIASSKITSNPIQPHTSVQVGISASVESGEEPAILDFVMSTVKIKNYFINDGDVNGDISDDSDENVGRIFFKDISSKDDLIYDSEGNCYVKNQMLITVRSGVSFKTVSNLAFQMYGKIVGYIELTNDYQIEFIHDKSADELLREVDYISHDPIIEYASPNIVSEVEYDSFPNDPEIQPESDVKIDKRNWSLYSINAPGAWDKYENCEQTYPVKIGVIDKMFYKGNDELSYVKVWNNPEELKDDHGTNVAGIIGAKFNNKKGTAGICPKSQLYGFSTSKKKIGGKEFTNIMGKKYALALMIGNGVKVINMSMGQTESIEEGSDIIEMFLKKLLNLGYDFVIVTSAGNQGNKTNPELFDAKNNSFFNNISPGSEVYNRIIVVGSVEHKTDKEGVPKKDKDGNYSLECEFKNSSSYGSRVDIVAPGADVYSIDKPFSGTSAAAPQVAGVAGLLYSIDPGLSGSEVKEIIISSANESAKKNPKRKIKCDKGDGFEYPLLDAKAAVVKVLKKNGTYDPSDEDEKDEAIVYGTVTDQNDKTVSGAKIKITSSDGELYSKEETADEKGEYTFTLPFGTYDIKFYIDEEPALKNLYCGKWFTIKDKKIEKDEDGFIQAYPLNVMLKDTEKTSVGVFDLNEKELSEISLSVKKDGSSEEYSAVINSKGFVYGEPEDGSYTIVVSKAGYTSWTITAEAKDGKLYAENGELLEKISLEPVSEDAPAYLSDPDYALYSALPEPEANEIYALVRVAVSGEKLWIYNCYSLYDNAEDFEKVSLGTVDYSDGTSSEIVLHDYDNPIDYEHHTYDEAGDYIVKITYTPVEGIKNSFNFYRQESKLYPIGVKIGSDVIYDDVANYISPDTFVGAIENVKYVKFYSDYWCSDKFSFTGASFLQRIEYTASKKFASLNGYGSYGKFSFCYALDFSNLTELFSEITEVSRWGFKDCRALTEMSLPKCTKIEDEAFSGCYSLRSINIPNCKEISVNKSPYYTSGAFSQCRSLVMINLPVCESIGEDAFYGCNSLQKVYAPQCREVGPYAFGYCSALTDVKLSDSCIYGDDAFIGCTRLVPSPART